MSNSPLGHLPDNWRLVTLTEIATKIGSGATPRGGSEVYLSQRLNFAFVRSQNIFDRRFDTAGLVYLSDKHATELKGVWLQEGDILLNITGDGVTFGRACVVPSEILPACVNQHVSIIRVNRQHCIPEYVVSYLNHPDIKQYIESFNAGGSRRAITKGHIESFIIPLPPLSEQFAIAEILGSLDDKIELNRRMNETLEGMARAIFKSWFVDFDPVHAKVQGEQPVGMDGETAALFPDSFEESELGLIPTGWRVGVIGDLASLQTSSINPAKYSDEKFWHYSLPAYDEAQMPKLEFGSEIKSSKHAIPLGCVLLSKLNPKNLKVWIPMPYEDFPSIASTEFLIIVSGNGFSREYLYTLFNMEVFTRTFANLVTGTSSSHQRVKPEYFMGMDVVIPSTELIKRFTSITEPIYQQVLENRDTSRTLATLRDALLLKLVSGEIRIANCINNMLQSETEHGTNTND
jgi:type I restriction enzyme S subunit